MMMDKTLFVEFAMMFVQQVLYLLFIKMIKYSLHVKSVILCNHSLIQAGFYAFFYFLNEQLVADADVLSLSFSSSHNSTLMR